jgi:RNA polymerase sigma factor (sigma-70 family)
MAICQSTNRGIPDHPQRRSNKLFHLVMFSVVASGKVTLLPLDIRILEEICTSDQEETVVATQQSILANNAHVTGFAAQQSPDSQLLSAAKKGDQAAFGALFERHSKKILHSTLRITRNREDAEDALQDCFLSGLLHLNDFDGRSQLSTWLTRIAINAALMKLRRNRYSRELPMEFEDEEGKERPRFQIVDGALNPEDSFVERERTMLLRDALGGLRPRVRAAVEICQLQECSVKETARKLGISTAAAKGRLFHARVALRKACLQKTNPAARRLRPAA